MERPKRFRLNQCTRIDLLAYVQQLETYCDDLIIYVKVLEAKNNCLIERDDNSRNYINSLEQQVEVLSIALAIASEKLKESNHKDDDYEPIDIYQWLIDKAKKELEVD